MIYLILAILLFSFSNVLWKKNIQLESISFLISYRSFFTSCISILILIFYIDLSNFTLWEFTKISIGSIFGVLGLFSMLFILKKSSLQWIGIYNLIGVGFTALYVWILEDLDVSKVLFGLVIIGLGFIYFIYSNTRNQLKITWKDHITLLVMTLSFTAASIIHWGNLTSDTHPILIIANQETLVFLTGITITLKSSTISSLKPAIKNNFSKILIMSLVVLLALISSLLGLKITNPLVSGALFLASPLTTILFSAYFFKESVSTKNWVAIAILALGAFLLHIETI